MGLNRTAPDDQQFPGQGLTYTEWVQSIIPQLSEKDADRVLWECTAFPMVQGYNELLPKVEAVRDQINGGMTLQEVIDEVYRKIDEEIARRDLEDSYRTLQDTVRSFTERYDLPARVRTRKITDVETNDLI
jgi:hypothetical protein